MEERRNVKKCNKTEYERLDRIIKQQCNIEKETWLDSQCEEIEDLEEKDRQAMNNKVKELANLKKYCSSSSCIKEKRWYQTEKNLRKLTKIH